MNEAERNTSIAPPRVHYPGAVRPTVWIETLGCPKNQVDSDKLGGRLAAQGYVPALGPDRADLVVVNTCAFVESARQESVDTILELAQAKVVPQLRAVPGVVEVNTWGGQRRTLDVVGRPTAMARWRVALPELDANAHAVAIQRIRLENEGWERDTEVVEPAEPSLGASA